MKPIHQPHEQPVKTKTFGPNLSSLSMQNNPFRAAYHNGHDLSESYKLPAPNAKGENLSYHRPTANNGGGANSQKLQAKQKLPAGPIQTGKNMA